jgi:hypothetical protein
LDGNNVYVIFGTIGTCSDFDGDNLGIAVAGATPVSCSGSSCDATVSAWEDDDGMDITEVEDGTYLIIAVIDSDESEEFEGPEAGDVSFCSDTGVNASTTELTLDNGHIVTF